MSKVDHTLIEQMAQRIVADHIDALFSHRRS
jgi:hypothetical protein